MLKTGEESRGRRWHQRNSRKPGHRDRVGGRRASACVRVSWAVTGGELSRGGTHASYPKAAQAAQSGPKTDTAGIRETGPGPEATHITQER